MIIQIEDTLGNTIGSILLNTSAFDEFNDSKAFERVDGDISIADVDFDDIYDTNDRKIRIQLEEW